MLKLIALAGLLALTAVPASADIVAEVEVYELPTGTRPHDVAPAPDGLVWYTAQRRGALGILDPQSGAIEEVPLGPGSAPHGVIQGPDGAAWITDGGQNAIVRYRPDIGAVDVWPLPSGSGRANLNTAAFDGNGVLWFTGQNGIYGRFDPASEAIEAWPAPGGRGPYGITATPDGDIWYASLAGSHIARIDTATGEAARVDLPTPDQGARRVWSDSRGRIWISEWNAGQLTVHDPETGDWQSWPLPSGSRASAYAVYVDANDVVWVSDFHSSSTYAFEPDSEEFTRFPNSGERGDVRQILGRAGEVWLPESGLDRLMVLRIPRSD